MPADFVPPQFNNPDFLRSMVLGQESGTAAALAPYQVAGAQQGLQKGSLDLQAGQLNLDQLKMMMGMQQQAMGTYQSTMQGISAQGGAQGAGESGGIQNGPQGAVSSTQSNDPLAQFLDPRRIAANTAYGQFNAMRSGKDPNEVTANAVKLETDARDYQQKQRQLQVQGPMSLADTVAGSADADKIILNNPSLQQQWLKIAPQLGLNPYKDLTPANARMVARFGYNQLAGSAGLPPKEMPNQLQTMQRGLGESIQTDPVTGKVTAGAPAMPTEKYIVNGQVVERPKAEGVGKGMTPYDTSLFAATQISKAALEDAYQQAKATGTAPPTAGRDPIAIAQEKSYIADRMRQDGQTNTGEYMAAKQQAYQAQQKVVTDFTDPSGKAGGALVAINTAVKHVGALDPLIDAMGSGNVTRINQARQAYQKATGVPAPTNYQTLANMAVGEINKAVTANGGDATERASIAAPFDPEGGPAVLKGAVKTAVTALAGKTDALRNAWDVGTNGSQGSFDKFLLPDTKKALGQDKSAHPAGVQALLDKYK